MATSFARFDPTPFVGSCFAENAISPPTPAKVAKAAKVGTGPERFSRFSDFSGPTPAKLKNEHETEPAIDGADRLLDTGPTEPCPKCGGRNFWRESMTATPWRCRSCVPPHPGLWTDGVFLPPPGAVPSWPAPKKSNRRPIR